MTRVSPARLAAMVQAARNNLISNGWNIYDTEGTKELTDALRDALRAALAVPEPAPDDDGVVIRAAVGADDTGNFVVLGYSAIADDDELRREMERRFGARVIAFATIRVPRPRVVEVEAEVTKP